MTALIAWTTLPIVVVASLLWVGPVYAQDDFRHVDENRPLRVEDAYPIKFKEWEWEIGMAGTIAGDGEGGATSLLEIKTGIARNWELGMEAHMGWERRGGASAAGVEGFGLHLLYNLNQEGRSIPAFAIRTDVMTPGLGDVGMEEVTGRFRGMVTKSLGPVRVHGNATYTVVAPSDGTDYWSVGLAFDHPFGLTSRALLGDVYVEQARDGESVVAWIDLGSRVQLTKSVVIDVGLASRLDAWGDGRPNVTFTVGLSRAFGFIGLVRVPPYPDPRIN